MTSFRIAEKNQMQSCTDEIRLFSDDELEALHQASLDILADPGMRIMTPALLEALNRHGAAVDGARQVVRFPRKLVDETIAGMQADLRQGRKPILLNGVITSRSSGPIQAKFGGACIEYFDWEWQQVRSPTRQDLIDLVKLGQALPEVTTVGNPVMYLTEDDGSPVDPRLQRVKTAALIACYTTKAGPTEVWNARELDFLMEIGAVVRGSREDYLANPLLCDRQRDHLAPDPRREGGRSSAFAGTTRPPDYDYPHAADRSLGARVTGGQRGFVQRRGPGRGDCCALRLSYGMDRWRRHQRNTRHVQRRGQFRCT